MTSQTNLQTHLESVLLGIFCYEHIIIEHHSLVFANIHSKPSAELELLAVVSKKALHLSPAPL